ncbi:hypothetical protein HYH02_010345 [Chlamydomonas schloesseri]|uniref:Thioredoxin domain-containing protein n=1 Tax=Chlamydomonas schloesseri TaxID=2026947 RepID=A0A835TC25_9CHLO|nr:hypothetical protein HYH02_010345 [Chlamydomonas schloesseri]|eukprot:KAG2440463.1 hypothetical protein HYH02_010345 [Chlamydomonas schloesseri]
MIIFGEVDDFEGWERYAGFLCGMYGLFRAYKARSRQAGIAALVDYAQIFVAVMALVCSPFLLAYYVIAYGLIYLLFPQPMLPLHERLEKLTPEMVLDDVRQPGCDTTWIIYHYAPYHRECRLVAPVVADLAARYGTDRLKFAALDVGEFTKTAQRLGLDLSAVSTSLPALILYEKGEEVARLPYRRGSGGLAGAGWGAKDVVKAFELDMRYTRSLQKASEGKKGQ